VGRRRPSRVPDGRAEACTPAEPPLLLTPEQAFAAVQVGRTHGWKMIRSGAIPSVRLSPRIVRVPKPALEALIAGGGVQGATASCDGPCGVTRGPGDCAMAQCPTRWGRYDAQSEGAGPSKPAPAEQQDLHNPGQELVSCPPPS
jgi:hypothetical protein